MPPSEEEIKKIIELWNDGLSYGEITKVVNPGKRSTVQGWIENLLKHGYIKPRTNGVCTRTKIAAEARRIYCSEKRLALMDAGMKKLEEMLPGIDKPSGLKDWFIALGIGIDKMRLEDPPQSTNEIDLLTKFTEELEDHAVSTKTGRRVLGLPEDAPNTDVRISEERQN